MARLSFYGAARNVTGSAYLLETPAGRLLVDCGLYQERALRERNWNDFPVPPGSVDAIVLTHAHLDHCGLLPKLARDGFRGRVYCTHATADIVRIVLADAAKVQAEDAEFKKRRHEREGRQGTHPEVPLYTAEDVDACLPLLEPVGYEEPFEPLPDVSTTLHEAGHILGSAMPRFELPGNGRRDVLIFSGDIGRWDAPIVRDPTLFDRADYVVVESTYGDRIHKPESSVSESLARAITDTHRAGGNVLIPSFAIERTQEVLYRLGPMLRDGRIPRMPVFVDSPMAIRVTEIFRRHPELFDEETRERLRRGEHPCDFPNLTLCRTVEESKAVNAVKEPAIVIAGSGMCTGGRIKHHLANNLARPESTLLFVGYQAQGTLGRILLEGAREIRLFGQTHPVRLRVKKINGFSAHADRDELHRWLSALQSPPRRVFVTHGEPETAERFAGWLRKTLRWTVSVPEYRETAELDG